MKVVPGILFMIAWIYGCESSTSTPYTPVKENPPYTLPDNPTLTFQAERGPRGEIYIVGQTDLPDRLKLWVTLYDRKGRYSTMDGKVFVGDGKFR